MEKLNEDLPNIIEPLIVMLEPNSEINIFEGDFTLVKENVEIKISGKIYFGWFPNLSAKFTGVTEIESSNLFSLTEGLNNYDLILNSLVFSKCRITSTIFGSHNLESQIKGIATGRVVKGDKSIGVEKLSFSIPNLREYEGAPVKRNNATSSRTLMNRLRLENEDWVILIDKALNYKELNESLNARGGYLIQYNGELTNKKGSILYENTKEIFHCLNTFLSFLNGRRTSAMFIHGIYQDETIWTDYTPHFVDSQKYVYSWSQIPFIDLNGIWNKFYSHWKDESDKGFLISAVHWYVESNSNSGFTEGSIIMAQTALELIYNWLLIEKKKMLIGKDSENSNASNKIRLLLSQLNLSYNSPATFTQLQAFIDNSNEVIDAPDAVVQIRNAIVHSQEDKRKKLSAISHGATYEALQLCISYIELSLLCILGFEGSYFDRCAGGLYLIDSDKKVPWSRS